MEFAGLKTCAENESVAFGFPDLVQLAGVSSKGTVIAKIEREREGRKRDRAGCVSRNNEGAAHVGQTRVEKRGHVGGPVEVIERDFVRQPPGQQNVSTPGAHW